jgi:hypothetical protein
LAHHEGGSTLSTDGGDCASNPPTLNEAQKVRHRSAPIIFRKIFDNGRALCAATADVFTPRVQQFEFYTKGKN